MAKRWSANSLLAQVLLICLVGTNVEVLGQKGGKTGQNQQTNFQTGSQQTLTRNTPVAQPAGWPSYTRESPPVLGKPNDKPSYPGQNQQTNFQTGSGMSFPQYRGSTNAQSNPSQYSQLSHDQNPYVPRPGNRQQQQQAQQAQRAQHAQRTSEPLTPGQQLCEVQQSVRIPCGAPGISASECEEINCCFHGQQCFFGNAVTVQCTKDGQFIVIVARDATLPKLAIETISLMGAGEGCRYLDSNSAYAIFQFPVTACGSVVMEEPGVILYENRMSSSYEIDIGPDGIITRDSSFELLFQCKYTATSVETVIIEVFPLPDPPLSVAALGPIRVQLTLANGQCLSKGCNELDRAYTSFYTASDYPVSKPLRESVYVQVELLDMTDPNLVLTLGHCWTTTQPNPHTLPQWDLLINGCPNRDDRYLSSLIPIGPSSGLLLPSHYRRFLFKMFTFVDSRSLEALNEQVYIHCSTAVCTPGQGRSCEPSCFRKKRDADPTHWTSDERKVVVSVGPVIMVDEESLKNVKADHN